jgi:hypothetical protein
VLIVLIDESEGNGPVADADGEFSALRDLFQGPSLGKGGRGQTKGRETDQQRQTNFPHENLLIILLFDSRKKKGLFFATSYISGKAFVKE